MRPTADIDIIAATGATDLKSLTALAGKGSALARQHHVYLDIVTVAIVPEDYELWHKHVERTVFMTMKTLLAGAVVLQLIAPSNPAAQRQTPSVAECRVTIDQPGGYGDQRLSTFGLWP